MAVYDLKTADQWLNVVSITMKEAALRGLNAAAQRTVNHIQTEVIPACVPEPVARGVYKAGWHVVQLHNGAEVVNTVPQAAFIEYGVRAENVKIGRGMIDALAEWVRMKGIGGKVTVSKGGLRKVKKATLDEARAIAWAIAKSMQKKGIFNGGQGFKVLEKAGKMIPRFIREEVVRELKKEFSR
jgi:hypothetical protein